MFTITVKDKIVLTRKEHRCFACWRKFPPKTSMNYNVSISDDGLYDCYSCPTCQLLWQSMANIYITNVKEFIMNNVLLKLWTILAIKNRQKIY